MSPDTLATLTAALIGALVGSVGAVTLDHWLGDRASEKQARKRLAKKHLYQLLDALETLWYRLDNLETWGNVIRDSSYFKTSNLYAVGRALALERVLQLEGVMAELAHTYPRLVQVIRKNTHEMFRKLGGFQYDRLVLAESLLEWSEQGYRVITFYEFQSRYTQQTEADAEWRKIIDKVIEPLLETNAREKLRKRIKSVVNSISADIEVPPGLPDEL